MPLPTFTSKTDGVDDVLASHVNDIQTAIVAIAKGVGLADYVNTETLAATKTFTDTDEPLHYLDPGGASRDVNLPAEASTNNPFVIVNQADAAENLVVKSDAPATIVTVGQSQIGILWSNGVVWRGAVLAASAGDMSAATYDPATIAEQLVGLVATQTLTNKRITKRIVTTTQAAEPAINTDNGDVFLMTGLAQAITSLTTNLTGTPTDGQMFELRITDNGTARAITPGASFLGTVEFPLAGLTTTLSKTLYLLWKYSSALSAWELSGKLNQA